MYDEKSAILFPRDTHRLLLAAKCAVNEKASPKPDRHADGITIRSEKLENSHEQEACSRSHIPASPPKRATSVARLKCTYGISGIEKISFYNSIF